MGRTSSSSKNGKDAISRAPVYYEATEDYPAGWRPPQQDHAGEPADSTVPHGEDLREHVPFNLRLRTSPSAAATGMSAGGHDGGNGASGSHRQGSVHIDRQHHVRDGTAASGEQALRKATRLAQETCTRTGCRSPRKQHEQFRSVFCEGHERDLPNCNWTGGCGNKASPHNGYFCGFHTSCHYPTGSRGARGVDE